ncbi:MAG TPA: DUF2177 family protein [Mesorhizobium sp.]|uniref:DUF2177 family protein n=1 Tax=Mesorhizobium sp. TaxID=1871066 RepID=UPI002DDD857B|nr:DUF2177 family protein [Mesorhizobium sp.]HEV2502731.1 DUF2177 family protein [Mesorhizobium sp.]
MTYIVAYIASLIVFGALDAIWLTTMTSRIYRPVLGDILLSDLRIAPALAFYLLYPVGLVVFAAMPALRAGSAGTALGHGALFGLIAYATYDLTNYATLRSWTLQITLIDLAYGTVVAGLTALAAYQAARWVAG